MRFSGPPLQALRPDGTVWFAPVWRASTFGERLRGLMFTHRESLGLWFPGCRGVHSHWMRYPLDVLFLGPGGVVLRHQVLKPWSSISHPQADSLMEIPLGFADLATLPDRICLALPATGTTKGNREALVK